MVGERQRAQNTVGERQERRARQREKKNKTKQEKKGARVSGREFEEGNIRLFFIFAYNAVESRAGNLK